MTEKENDAPRFAERSTTCAQKKTKKEDPAVDFSRVLTEELDEICKLRLKRGANSTVLEGTGVFKRARDANLVGLAFSGGGIRSATFNLGILQGLAKLGLLPMVDYLSTVSGGGYIGGWLEAWIYRARQDSSVAQCDSATIGKDRTVIRRIEECLKPDRSQKRQHQVPRPISFLREYSNYLTPRVGFLNGDTWAAVAIYLRNLLLNQLILVLFLGSILLVPYMVAVISRPILDWQKGTFWIGLIPILAFILPALAGIACNMTKLRGIPKNNKRIFRFYAKQWYILVFVAGPLYIAAWLGSLWLSAHAEASWPMRYWACGGSIIFGIPWTIASVLNLPEQGTDARYWNAPGTVAWSIFCSAISGAAGGLLLSVLTKQVVGKWSVATNLWHTISFGTPLVAIVFLAAAALQIGLMGILFPDPRREWWGRLGGYLFIISIIWTATFAIAIYAPLGLMWLKGWLKGVSLAAWVGTTLTGLIGGRSPKQGDPHLHSAKDTALSVTPYVFIVGMLSILAWLMEVALARFTSGTSYLSDFLAGSPTAQKIGGWIIALHFRFASARGFLIPQAEYVRPTTYVQAHWNILSHALSPWVFVVLLVLLGLCLLLSLCVNLNEFSMNLFYRNRLVRAYLGASHSQRNPNPFTGFDSDDDLLLKDLRAEKGYSGPLPIINTTLNLIAGKDLAWQERKGASFVFTPIYCGFDAWLEQLGLEENPATLDLPETSCYAYRPTNRFLYGSRASIERGPRLGTAVSISGAAASPNMGYHSSASLAFLMTFFNVRLGFWAGNPRHSKTWTMPGPRIGLFRLLAELFGQTDDEARFVYLSDGGHFENLGLYELIKRRCKFIIVSDAGCDSAYTFGDLGNAIRKCREDIGVNIDLRTDHITPKPRNEKTSAASSMPNAANNSDLSDWHWAVGAIQYSCVDLGAQDGILVYLKSSLTGDESADVLNYHRQHSDFPHQTTANQWFTESQFESYRMLGEHIMQMLFEGVSVDGSAESIFTNLKDKWTSLTATHPVICA